MILLCDQVFILVLHGCGYILQSASYGWRAGVVCVVVFIVVTRGSIATGGGCHRLAKASVVELSVCDVGVIPPVKMNQCR